MPIKLMDQLATMTFPDDDIESPLQFDTNLDFWEYYYDQEVKNNGVVDFWHVPK